MLEEFYKNILNVQSSTTTMENKIIKVPLPKEEVDTIKGKIYETHSTNNFKTILDMISDLSYPFAML
jgi:hypothetical protein